MLMVAEWLRVRGRRGRVAAIAGASAGLAAALAMGVSIEQERRADALLAQARARLTAPFLEAPTLDRLQASTAISLLERARSLGRDGHEIRGFLHYAEAIEDLQRGDLILAEGELATALTHLGPTVDLHVLAAALSRARMLNEEAEREIAAALASDPGHLRGRLLAADLALDRGDGAAARDHLERLAAEEPRSGPVWNRLGLARELLGDFAGAERAYRRATELDRLGQDPWINLGRLLRSAGRHDEALAAFENAVARAPSDPAARLGRGLCRFLARDVGGAMQDFERAAELAPNDAEPLLALGDLLRDAGRIDEAIATYRRAIEREDADAASWLKLGNALGLAGRWEEARAAFAQAVARAPALGAARNGLGAALMHLGRIAEAGEELERAAALDPVDPNPLLNLALLREREGDREAARRAWRRVLERAPGLPIAEARLARLERG
jgi:tetratricopeptide (TPR) repeat protein